MRTVIVGDIGGQYHLFRDVIESAGGNPDTCVLPSGLLMIQVGDIVRFNNSADLDSLACAEYAQRLLENNDGRYIQLLGNHETPLLGGVTDPKWKLQALPLCQPIVESWWDQKLARLGVVLRKEGQRDLLITHAGLTRGYRDWLGTVTAVETAQKLNSFVGEVSIADIQHPGGLVTGNIDQAADPCWALIGSEVHDSWKDHHPNFNQLHGHATLLDWDTEKYWDDVPEYVKSATTVNLRDRYTTTIYDSGYTLRSVDWVLKNSYRRQEWPLLFLTGYELIM